MPSCEHEATFYRAALLLGLVSGESVVAWADRVIVREADVPPAVLDVAVTAPGDLSALRAALQPLALVEEPPAVIDAIFDRARGDLVSGRRSVADTITLLAQVRRLLTVARDVDETLDAFQDSHMLAVAGVIGNVATIEAQVRTWLAPFEGAEPALLATPVAADAPARRHGS